MDVRSGGRLRRGPRALQTFAVVVTLALFAAGCGDDGDNGAAAPSGQGDGKLAKLADGFPDRPITLWAGYAAGHPNDLLNRRVAEIASDYSPVRITADNRETGPGSNYSFVRDFFSNLPLAKEGYAAYSANWGAQATGPYEDEVIKDLELGYLHPIAALYTTPFAYAVMPDSEFKSLEDVLTYAKANPGKLRYVSGQAGSRGQLEMTLFLREAGVEMTFVPTDGVDESAQVIRGGGAQLFGSGLHSIDLKTFRVLAVGGSKRLEVLPESPTMTELGYKGATMGLDGYAINGFGTLPEVNAERQAWLVDLFEKVVEDPRFKEAYHYANVALVPGPEIEATMVKLLDALFPVLKEEGLNVRER
jgi:tripartite-type tricarboxylate transporter receptor subunit TctC